jgi:hypothetical protein
MLGRITTEDSLEYILQVGKCEIRIHDSKESKNSIYLSNLKNYMAKRIKATSDRNNVTPKATVLEKLRTLRW